MTREEVCYWYVDALVMRNCPAHEQVFRSSDCVRDEGLVRYLPLLKLNLTT